MVDQSLMVSLAQSAFLENEGLYIPTLGAASLIAIITIRTIGSVLRSNGRERTRREIAAYIAEGSMSPEQGERLMKAGKD